MSFSYPGAIGSLLSGRASWGFDMTWMLGLSEHDWTLGGAIVETFLLDGLVPMQSTSHRLISRTHWLKVPSIITIEDLPQPKLRHYPGSFMHDLDMQKCCIHRNGTVSGKVDRTLPSNMLSRCFLTIPVFFLKRNVFNKNPSSPFKRMLPKIFLGMKNGYGLSCGPISGDIRPGE
eukprot:1154042-Pelagomonas_calceolata.AAC.2